MTTQELAKLYQDGTDWNDEMEAAQNKYIVDNIEEIFRDFTKAFDELQMEFGSYIGLRIGIWQADNGFIRPFPKDYFKKLIEEK